MKFPAVDVGLPEGCENTDLITSHEIEGEMTKFFSLATTMHQQPLEKLLQECHPDCLTIDMFLPWTTNAATKFGIPRLVFHGISCFSLCTLDCLNIYMPYKKSSSDSKLFVVPELPGDIKFRSKHLPEYVKQNVETDFTRLIQKVRESSLKIFGIVVCRMERKTYFSVTSITSEIPHYERLCKSCQVNTKSPRWKKRKRELCYFNNKNLHLHIGYVPIYINRGSDYFF
jgi:hypothetical protein